VVRPLDRPNGRKIKNNDARRALIVDDSSAFLRVMEESFICRRDARIHIAEAGIHTHPNDAAFTGVRLVIPQELSPSLKTFFMRAKMMRGENIIFNKSSASGALAALESLSTLSFRSSRAAFSQGEQHAAAAVAPE